MFVYNLEINIWTFFLNFMVRAQLFELSLDNIFYLFLLINYVYLLTNFLHAFDEPQAYAQTQGSLQQIGTYH
jgi:hypothetical protein